MNHTQPFPVQIDSGGPFAGIATLTLECPGKPVVVLDLLVFQRLEATLRALPRGLIGLVLASASERAFVAGADLKSIMDMDDAPLDAYLQFGSRVFGQLSQLPYPTAAAIHGAALGGGLELAMHCDALIGAPPPPAKDGQPGRPYPVGLPEAGLKICPGWGGTNLLPARMDPADAIRRTATGTPMTFDQAVQAGLFDEVAASASALPATAKRWVQHAAGRHRVRRDGAPSRWIGRPACASGVLTGLDAVRAEIVDSEPGLAVANAVDRGLSMGWKAALAVERRELIRLRHTPPAREAIAAFFAKSSQRK